MNFSMNSISFALLLTIGSSLSYAGVKDVDQHTMIQLLQWDNLLPNDAAFASPGHENSLVKVYFNSIAEPTFRRYQPGIKLEFPPGSIIAKSFVADQKSSRLAAKRIFYMTKMDKGYDPENGDWSYTSYLVDKSSGDFMKLDQGRIPDCIGCHKAYQAQDYVLTLQRYYESKGLLQRMKDYFAKFLASN